MDWILSHRAHPRANALAKRHYTCQSPESDQFMPPGAALVLMTPRGDAVWGTSWPLASYTKHAWAGAWVCSIFRNESAGAYLSSDLIRQAVSATRWYWPSVPSLGMVTFVDAAKTRRKRDPGRCFRRAGFTDAECPLHTVRLDGCPACASRTVGGLVALQLRPPDMPDPLPPCGAQFALLEAVS